MKYYYQYWGYSGNNDGYSAINEDLHAALSKHGWEQDTLSPIAIIHALPEKRLLDEFRQKAKYLIAFTMLESTKIPDSWVTILNEFDEVWCPSEWVKGMFMNNGVTKPIYVMPHGVNTDVFKYYDRSSQLTDEHEKTQPVQVLPLQRILHEPEGMGHAANSVRGRVQGRQKRGASLQDNTRQHTRTGDDNATGTSTRRKTKQTRDSGKA